MNYKKEEKWINETRDELKRLIKQAEEGKQNERN